MYEDRRPSWLQKPDPHHIASYESAVRCMPAPDGLRLGDSYCGIPANQQQSFMTRQAGRPAQADRCEIQASCSVASQLRQNNRAWCSEGLVSVGLSACRSAFEAMPVPVQFLTARSRLQRNGTTPSGSMVLSESRMGQGDAVTRHRSAQATLCRRGRYRLRPLTLGQGRCGRAPPGVVSHSHALADAGAAP